MYGKAGMGCSHEEGHNVGQIGAWPLPETCELVEL